MSVDFVLLYKERFSSHPFSFHDY